LFRSRHHGVYNRADQTWRLKGEPQQDTDERDEEDDRQYEAHPGLGFQTQRCLAELGLSVPPEILFDMALAASNS
jgi:hypothetical protein